MPVPSRAPCEHRPLWRTPCRPRRPVASPSTCRCSCSGSPPSASPRSATGWCSAATPPRRSSTPPAAPTPSSCCPPKSTTTMGGLLLAAGVVGLLLALATHARARSAAILAANTVTDAATLEPLASEELDDLDDDHLDEGDVVDADARGRRRRRMTPTAGRARGRSRARGRIRARGRARRPRRNPRRTASDARGGHAQRCLRTSSMNATGSSTQMRSPVMVCSPPRAPWPGSRTTVGRSSSISMSVSSCMR